MLITTARGRLCCRSASLRTSRFLCRIPPATRGRDLSDCLPMEAPTTFPDRARRAPGQLVQRSRLWWTVTLTAATKHRWRASMEGSASSSPASSSPRRSLRLDGHCQNLEPRPRREGPEKKSSPAASPPARVCGEAAHAFRAAPDYCRKYHA
jgi:hypothetical protein